MKELKRSTLELTQDNSWRQPEHLYRQILDAYLKGAPKASLVATYKVADDLLEQIIAGTDPGIRKLARPWESPETRTNAVRLLNGNWSPPLPAPSKESFKRARKAAAYPKEKVEPKREPTPASTGDAGKVLVNPSINITTIRKGDVALAPKSLRHLFSLEEISTYSAPSKAS